MAIANNPNTLVLLLTMAMAMVLSGAGASSSSSSSSATESPVVEFYNNYGDQVAVYCVAVGMDEKLNPGQSYSFKVDARNEKVENAYSCEVDGDYVYVKGQGYDAVRDKDRTNIYWLINKVGLHRGYDKIHWVLEDKWSTLD